jgi:phosphonatase-like hydrolase
MTNVLPIEKPAIKLVLFDVIGTTIIESKEGIINHCFEDAFSFFDLPVSTAFINSSRGKSKREVISDVLRKYNRPVEQSERVYARFQDNVLKALNHFTPAPGSAELFTYLTSKGMMIALGSGLPHDLFNHIFTATGWARETFHYIGTADDVVQGRPDPAMIVAMMSHLAIDNPKQVLKVGDTVSDVREGKNAGVITAAVLSGTQPDDILLKENPDFIVRHLSELKLIL